MAGYGKVFDSIYDGSLADDWKALVTMQQLIVLADRKGQVDMTAGALSRRTGIPREIIDHGLTVLAAPDADSRSPDEDGRRIVLIDPARPWGWRLVNHDQYRLRLSQEEKRAADRERLKAKRDAEKAEAGGAEPAAAESTRQDATCRKPSRGVAGVAHTASTSTATADQEQTPSSSEISQGAPARQPDPNGQRDDDKPVPCEDQLPGWVPLPAWREFFRHREAIGKPLSIPAVRQVVKRLVQLREEGHDLVASLEQTVAAGLSLPVTPTGAGQGARASPGRARAAVDRVQAHIDAATPPPDPTEPRDVSPRA
jgi:hypothetical protein